MFLHDLCTTNYQYLQNVNTEIETEPYLLLSHILMSLKSDKISTKEIFVMVQQQYDDEHITFSYMVEVSQEVTAILSIFHLLLECRLGMKVSRYFRSSYSIGIDEYECDDVLHIVVATGADNYLEEIERHWIQHTDDYDTRNKNYRNADHGGYAINARSFDIAGVLGRPRLMKDGNKSLVMMGMQNNYLDTNFTKESSLIQTKEKFQRLPRISLRRMKN